MADVRIDTQKLQADIEAADADVARLADQLRDLRRVHEAATENARRLRELEALMSTYLIADLDQDGALTSELTGLPATKALEKLLSLYPGATFRLDDSFKMLTDRGWEGEMNALQVAASRLTKRGVLERPQTSHYRIAQRDDRPPESAENHDEDEVDEPTVSAGPP